MDSGIYVLNFLNTLFQGDGFVTLKEEQDYRTKMDDEAKKQKEAYMQELFSVSAV